MSIGKQLAETLTFRRPLQRKIHILLSLKKGSFDKKIIEVEVYSQLIQTCQREVHYCFSPKKANTSSKLCTFAGRPRMFHVKRI